MCEAATIVCGSRGATSSFLLGNRQSKGLHVHAHADHNTSGRAMSCAWHVMGSHRCGGGPEREYTNSSNDPGATRAEFASRGRCGPLRAAGAGPWLPFLPQRGLGAAVVLRGTRWRSQHVLPGVLTRQLLTRRPNSLASLSANTCTDRSPFAGARQHAEAHGIARAQRACPQSQGPPARRPGFKGGLAAGRQRLACGRCRRLGFASPVHSHSRCRHKTGQRIN